ncbi:unnamed protein product [Rotaria socialis]|uniref:MULE transposase domain-containing protein n=1 Tax=Rotaria socialis TaxID=392032 RepID=A0A818HAI5_9BILA|nr:unnamed protein product [Rotaria socialis]
MSIFSLFYEAIYGIINIGTSINPHQLQKTSNISKMKNDDDRFLDLMQLSLINHNRIDIDTDSEPELDTHSDNHYYEVVDKDNITFGKTNRGGRELHMCGYSYQVKKENLTTTRWRCAVRSPACPVTIHTSNVDDSVIHWNSVYHHHAPNGNRELIKGIIAKIKSRVLTEPYPVVLIAEEEIRYAKFTKAQLAVMPLPSHMESALQKYRRKHIPALPSSLDFKIPLLYQSTWSGEKFIIADTQRKKVGGRLIMFGSNEQVDLLLNSTTWFCDGTFKTRPLIFDQVYIIQCLVGDEVFPAIYALTSNRQRKTYEEMLNIILELAANRRVVLRVKTIVSDYEEAWLLAVEKMLPNVCRLGCWFHFSQACYRNIQNLGLTKLYEDDPNIRLELKKFIALALLPRDQVKKGFKRLSKNADDRIKPFVSYFKNQWMNNMGPDLWCVADSMIRTNNSSEAYNRRFGSRMMQSHPNIWKFIHTLKNEEQVLVQKNIHQLIGGGNSFAATKRKKAKKAVKKTYQIVKLHRLFAEEKKSLEQLILGLSFLVDGLVHKCLIAVPQYQQMYPAPRPDVSESLEQMVTKGFLLNQNIVWHKTTHSQKRYYWILKPNGDDEIRVKVGSGVYGKVDRDLRILTSTVECKTIVHQFLNSWHTNGFLPGWKSIWTVFNIENYDISERRVKAIHRIIKDNVSRGEFKVSNMKNSDRDSSNIRLLYEPDFDIDDQEDGLLAENDASDKSASIQQLPSATLTQENQTMVVSEQDCCIYLSSKSSDTINDNDNRMDQATIINQTLEESTNTTTSTCSPTIRQAIKDIFSQDEISCGTIFASSDDPDPDPDPDNSIANNFSNIDETPRTSLQPLSQVSAVSTSYRQATPPTPTTTTTNNKKKRKRRHYTLREIPYNTRTRDAGAASKID